MAERHFVPSLKTLALVPLILTILLISSARSAEVSGVVRDNLGTPLQGARVTLANPDTSTVLETRSESSGSDSFDTVSSRT